MCDSHKIQNQENIMLRMKAARSTILSTSANIDINAVRKRNEEELAQQKLGIWGKKGGQRKVQLSPKAQARIAL